MAYLVPRDPFNITTLRRQMDDMFDQHFPFSALAVLKGETGLQVDVVEEDKAYLVRANVPGLAAKDLDVRVNEEGVTIKGAFSEEKEDKKQNYLLRERKSGSFMRTIALPNSDPEKAVAKFKDGVLELVVPKQEADKRQGRQLLIEE
ncbi:MAG: Hsp20/alpha crystallin family protein [Clostridium sp.]|nr:Hsp20/alpha crystallin family protein [Clostridium sp.]